MITMSVDVLTHLWLYRCMCGHCLAMNSENESICTQEIVEMVQLLDGGDVCPECITEHQDFSNVCLCRAVLTVALYNHCHRYGTGDIPTDANRHVITSNCLYMYNWYLAVIFVFNI